MTQSLPQQGDSATWEAQWNDLWEENERLRTALLTISTADDPDAPIDRATCAAVAAAALTGEQR